VFLVGEDGKMGILSGSDKYMCSTKYWKLKTESFHSVLILYYIISEELKGKRIRIVFFITVSSFIDNNFMA